MASNATQTTTMYLTDRALAARWDVSRDTIWRWKRATKIPTPIRLGENCTRWRLEDIERHEAKLDSA